MWEENPNGENPPNQVGTENQIHMQGMRWDLNPGPQRWKAGKEPLSQPDSLAFIDYCLGVVIVQFFDFIVTIF